MLPMGCLILSLSRRLLSQAFDEATGQSIPMLRLPRFPFYVWVQRREDREPDIDSEESVSEI